MKLGDIIKAMGGFGGSGTTPRTSFGSGPRFVPPTAPSGGFVRPALDAMGAFQRAQGRADEIAKRTEKTFRNPVVGGFLGIPSERQATQWTRSMDASIATPVPSPGTAAGAASLSGKNSLSALGPYGGLYRIERPPLAPGLTAGFEGQSLAGTWGPLLGSGAGHSLRAYSLPRATTGPFGSPELGGLGKLVRGYLGLGRYLDGLVARWHKPIEDFFKQAARRAWQLYPRDSEGRPIPPWNLWLYFLARAAYRLDDYEAMARFLDEIGADDSPDNVLFVRDLLAPTFDPKRPDRRTDWWLLDPGEARRVLRKRLGSLRYDGGVGRRDGELSYREDPIDAENPNDPYFYVVKRVPRAVSAEGVFFDCELGALLLQELAAVLPPRQHEVVSLALRGWTYERIARHMGITEGAVKAHMHKVRNNPLVDEVLLPRPALRPDGMIDRGRIHHG